MAKIFGRLNVVTGLFVIAIGLAPQLEAKGPNPVSIEASIAPVKGNADRFQVTVELNIKEGWHTYDNVPKGNPSPTTTVKLDLPKGVKALGDWKRPKGHIYLKDPTMTVFDGSIRFIREIVADKNAEPRKIGVTVSYQVCQGQKCLPPTEEKTSVVLVTSEDSKDTSTFTNKHFEAPIRLMVSSQPLNTAAAQMYPSPAMFDVDNDGKVELIVGDIFGSINVYENTNNTGKGDPIWSKFRPLKTANGEKIKVSNW